MHTKLSDFLAQVLITPSMRPGDKGICSIVFERKRKGGLSPSVDLDLLRALRACKQTGSGLFPVMAPAHMGVWAFGTACTTRTMWRGEYGRNRRKLLRDAVRWLRERGL